MDAQTLYRQTLKNWQLQWKVVVQNIDFGLSFTIFNL